MAAKPCPVTGCGALIRAKAVMCSEDWARLPYEMQQNVYYFARRQGKEELYLEAVAYLNALGPLPARTGVAAHA